MNNFEKQHFTNNLLHTVKPIKDKMWTIGIVTEFTVVDDKNEYESLERNLEKYWTALFTSIPVVDSSLMSRILLDQKFSLTEWVKVMAGLFKGKLLNQPYHLFLPPARMASMKIWGRLSNWYLSEEIPSYQGDTYWYDIFRGIENWQGLVDVTLKRIVWDYDQDHVALELTWHGLFESVVELDLRGPHDQLWTVLFKENLVDELSMVHATAFLITTQFLVQKSHGHFIPVNVNEKELVTLLQIPRAELMETEEFASTPSETEELRIVDYIIDRARPFYLEASRKLEIEIGQEIALWQERSEPKWKFAAERLTTDVLDQLVHTRHTFFGN